MPDTTPPSKSVVRRIVDGHQNMRRQKDVHASKDSTDIEQAIRKETKIRWKEDITNGCHCTHNR
jgi:hypothetical protein